MTEEKKKNPQKGDFIDLEKTDFKKKKYFWFFNKIYFIGIFFRIRVVCKSKIYNTLDLDLDLDLSNGLSQKQSNDPFQN